MQEKKSILAQIPFPTERKQRLRWLLAASTVPLFGMVAAFGIAPDTDTREVEIRTVVEDIPFPSVRTTINPNETFWRQERVQRGDTVASLLARLQVNGDNVAEFLRSARDAKTLQQLVPGRVVEAHTTAGGQLLSLRYVSGDETELTVEKNGDTFKTTEQPAHLERRVVAKSATIRSSLFGASDAANIPDSVAVQMAEIFSSDIDFHLDLRKGDRFSVVYEVFYNKGTPFKAGRILAAEFVNDGKTYRAIYFKDREGHDGYYTPDGKNLRKAFLRSPLEFSRVTSGFGMRYHPVHNEWRSHKGIDYGAPMGTKVRSTADGVVEFAGSQRGYGNIVIVRHAGQYSTAYGHLKGFAPGIRKGAKVSQSQTIGYVGMTGVATGPHLHYEFRVAGVQRNPLSVGVPVAFPITPKYRNDFLQAQQGLMEQLASVRGTNYALFE